MSSFFFGRCRPAVVVEVVFEALEAISEESCEVKATELEEEIVWEEDFFWRGMP